MIQNNYRFIFYINQIMRCKVARMADQLSFEGNWDKIMKMWTGNIGVNSINFKIKKAQSIYYKIKKEQLMYVVSVIGDQWPLHYYVVNMVIYANEEIDKTLPGWKNDLTRDELYRLDMLIERACVEFCEEEFN